MRFTETANRDAMCNEVDPLRLAPLGACIVLPLYNYSLLCILSQAKCSKV
jgi:hypothetical protein